MIACKPTNEEERLTALQSYSILDTPVDEDFDDITRLVAYICQAPIAVINLIDRDRQFFLSEVGLGVRETPLDISICAHALLQPGLFIVPDTHRDARFSNNPLVTGEPHLRFYAGALLQTPDGLPLGTLCVLDYKTRELTPEQKDALQSLARQVMSLIELRRRYKHEKNIAATLQRAMLMTPGEANLSSVAVKTIYEAAWNEAEVGGDFFDVFPLPDGKVALVVGDVAGKGLAAAARTAEAKYALRVYLREADSPADALERLNTFLLDFQQDDEASRLSFIALVAVILDTVTGETRIAPAGIEMPLVMRQQSGVVEAIENGGFPLGIEAGATYLNRTVYLGPGDLLLLMTDGLTEARRGGEFFGSEGVEEVLHQITASAPLQDIGQRIVDEARTFARGRLHDDVCLLLARRNFPD